MSTKKTNSVDFGYLSDNRLEKGKKNLLEETKQWKGGSHRERREAKQDVKKDVQRALKKHAKNSGEKVSWKKRALGIGGVLFIGGVGFFSFLSTLISFILGSGVSSLDVRDSANLKTVLFGGDPWLIYCVNNQTQDDRLPRVLEESAGTLKRSLGIRIGVLHCWDKMESGRTVAQRFKLKLSPPLSFVVANGNKPRVLNLVGLSKAEDLEKKIKPALTVDISRIDSLKKWSSLCTSRRSCIVIGHRQSAQKDTALNLVKPILEKHRGTKFVTVDTSFWKMKLDDNILKTRIPNQGGKGPADIICLARGDDVEGNNTHSGLFLQQLTSGSMSSLVQACEARSGLMPMKATPKIVVRPTKPKKVTPPAYRPTPAPRPPTKVQRTNVDRVGSRAEMERQAQDEALFEAVEESDATEDELSEQEEEEELQEASSSEQDEDEEEEEVEL